jgi:cytochrome P450
MKTTAYSMAYMFGLLALYPEEQEKLYQQTKEVLGERQGVSEKKP